MKKLIYCIVSIFALFLFAACDDSNPAIVQPNGDVAQVSSVADSLKDKIAKQDTVMNVYVAKVDSLIQVQNDLNGEVFKLKNDINEISFSGAWKICVILALAFSIIALGLFLWLTTSKDIVCVSNISKVLCLDDIRDIKNMKDEIDKINEKLKNIPSGSKQRNCQYKTNANPSSWEINQLKSEVDELKGQIAKLMSPVQTVLSEKKEQNNDNVLYSGINSGKYFVNLQKNQSSESVFVINVDSNGRGTFNIISLAKIKSRNNWQEVVELVDSKITIKEAQDFKVKEPGQCHEAGDGWVVDKKLKISIF